jgi:cytoskeleton protein RodZ
MGNTDPILFDLDDIKLEDIEPWQVDHVGAELAAKRMAMGITVESLAADLKIRGTFIQALEAGRYSDLPGLPYAIGYVRSIADRLGLDGEAYARTFKEQQGHNYVAPTLSLPEPEEIREGGSSKALLAAISIALGTLGYGGWLLYSQPSAPERTELVAARPAGATPIGDPTGTTPATAVHATAVDDRPAAADPASNDAASTDRDAVVPKRVEALAPAASTPPRRTSSRPPWPTRRSSWRPGG